MNHFLKAIAAVVLTAVVNSANAGIINFINLADGLGGYGEGAWSSLNLSSGGANVAITGHSSDDNDSTQYAYLDWGFAGLGSCKDALSTSSVNSISPLRIFSNCASSTDANVSKKEFLSFVFDKDVVISNIWFNNNFGGGFSNGDKVKIDGKVFDLETAYPGWGSGVGSFAVAAGYNFDVSYLNNDFYIGAIEFSSVVPEPGALMLLCIGMLAVFTARKTLVNGKNRAD